MVGRLLLEEAEDVINPKESLEELEEDGLVSLATVGPAITVDADKLELRWRLLVEAGTGT